jgi:hypothetical protein
MEEYFKELFEVDKNEVWNQYRKDKNNRRPHPQIESIKY